MAIPNFDDWDQQPEKQPPKFDDWVQQQQFAPLDNLKSFAAQNNLEVGSTTGGRHNRGSKHYSGNAIDIRNSGTFSDQQVQQLAQAASQTGLKLRDERTRPKGQKVWGGPHIHLETADEQIPKFDDWTPEQTPPSKAATQQPTPGQSAPPITQALDALTQSTNRATRKLMRRAAQPAQTDLRSRLFQQLGQQRTIDEQQRTQQQQAENEARTELQSERLLANYPGIPSGRGVLKLISDPVGKFSEALKSDDQIVQERAQQRLHQQQVAQEPEVTSIRKEYGQMPAAVRSVAAPVIGRGGSGLLKVAGGVASAFGIAPNKLSDWANKRAEIIETGSALPPLREQQNLSSLVSGQPQLEEVERGIPEKVATGIADLGVGLGQIILLKKATGLSFPKLLALEAAAKSSDKPVSEQLAHAGEGYVLGRALDSHLGRAATAGLFGIPTAAQTGYEVAQGRMSPLDAAIQTGIQAGAGAILAGKDRNALVRESRPEIVPGPPEERTNAQAIRSGSSPVGENVDEPQANIPLPGEMSPNAEVSAHNQRMLSSNKFRDVLLNESVGGNAGPSRAAVNMAIDREGRIVSIGNMQDLPRNLQDALNTGKLRNVSAVIKYEAGLTSPTIERFIVDRPSGSGMKGRNLTPDWSTTRTEDGKWELQQHGATVGVFDTWAEANKAQEAPTGQKVFRPALLDRRLEEYIGNPRLEDFVQKEIPDVVRIAQDSSSWRDFNDGIEKLAKDPQRDGPRGGQTRILGRLMGDFGALETYEAIRSIGSKGKIENEPQTKVQPPVEAQRAQVESGTATPEVGASRMGVQEPSAVVLTETRAADTQLPESTTQPQKFFHRDYGEVTESPNQQGVGKRKVRVVDVDGNEHVIKRSNLSGAGNQRAVPIRETPAQTSQEAPLKPLPKLEDNYRKPLKEYADTLYREVGPSTAEEMLPTSRTMASQGDVYFSNTPDLALGQGRNKGVLLEFEPRDIQGQVNRSKPAWETLYDQGQAEFIARHNTQKQYQDALKSITIRPDVQMTRMEKSRLGLVLKDLEDRGWTKTIGPEGTTYRRPAETQPTAQPPEPATPKEEVRPPSPPAPDMVRLYRADRPDAPEASGKGWANDINYVSQKYGAGQMGGQESIWYIDVPKTKLDEAFGDWRAVGITDTDVLRQNDIEVKPKLYRRISEPASATESVTETAVKNAAMEADRAARDLPELAQAEPRKAAEVHQRALNANQRDPRSPDRLVQQALSGDKNFTDVETAQLRLRAQEIKNREQSLLSEIDSATDPATIREKRVELDSLTDEFDRLSQATKKAGTEWGRAGVARQQAIDQDFSLVGMKARLKAAKGDQLTEAENAQVEDLYRRNAELESKLAAAEEKLSQKRLQSEVDRISRSQRRAQTREQIDAEWAQLKSQFAEVRQRSSAFMKSEEGSLDLERLRGIYRRLRGQPTEPVPEAVTETANRYRDLVREMIDLNLRIGDAGGQVRPLPKAEVDRLWQRHRELLPQIMELEREIRDQGYKVNMLGEVARPNEPFPSTIRHSMTLGKKIKYFLEGEEGTFDPAALKLIGKMVRNRVQAGVTDAAQLVDDIHAIVGGDKREVRDAISGYSLSPKRTRSDLQKQIDSLRSELKSLSKGEDITAGRRSPTQEGPQREFRRDQTRQRAIQKQIADLESQISSGNFATKSPRTPTPDNPETAQLRERLGRTRNEYKRLLRKQELDNRSKGEKAADLLIRWGRAAKLSYVSTLGKLSGAATGRMVISPIENLLGEIPHRLSPELSRRATTEGGGFDRAAEVAALWKSGRFKQMLNQITKGSSDLDVLYGGGKGIDKEMSGEGILGFPGRVHGALKEFPRQAEFDRAFVKVLRNYERTGKDISDPQVQLAARMEAYASAERARFQQRNFISDEFNNAMGRWERKGGLAKGAAKVGRFVFPITRVPVNVAGETLNYTLGIPRAAIETAIRGGVNKLTPEQANNIMRAYKKGGVGLAVMTYAYLHPQQFGGYYQKNDRRSETEPAPGEVMFFGHRIPKWATHIPIIEAGQLAATVRRVSDKLREQGEDKTEATLGGVTAGAKGVASGIPFYETPARFFTGQEGARGWAEVVGQQGKGMIPGFVQETAQLMDKDAQGKPIKRKPTGSFGQRVGQTVELGIPGLRSRVPLNERAIKSDRKAKLLDQFRKGEIGAADLAAEDLTPAERSAISRAGKLSEKQARFNNFPAATALDRFERMDAAAQDDVRDIMEKKAYNLLHSDTLSDQQKADFQERLDKLGITPQAPKKSSSSGFKDLFKQRTVSPF